jgi:RNA polymerase sigma-70 factor, ECF subfamily
LPADEAHQAADLRLMQAVATGDETAINQLYTRFSSLVYRMAIQALPTREEAEDAMQEVFIRLWKTSGRYDPSRAALVTWVMLITRRYLVDRLRRGRSTLRAGVLEERAIDATEASTKSASVAAVNIEQSERFKSVMERIDQLPDLQRTVVVRAYLNGQTLRQIGEELNTPLGTIKSALSRALVRLRERDIDQELSA